MGTPTSFPEFRRARWPTKRPWRARAIRQGAWGFAAGEHELARRLNISGRHSASARRLAEDGVVTISKGCRTRVNFRGRERQWRAADHLLVCLLRESLAQRTFGSDGDAGEFAVLGIGWRDL